jgi:hypothetical protein
VKIEFIGRHGRSIAKEMPTEQVQLMQHNSKAGAVMGLRVRSGWAMAVLLAGPVQAPRVLECRSVDLCDPKIPETKQPYHARMGQLENDERKIRERTQVVERAAARSIDELMHAYRRAGYMVRAAGLVVGSQVDPTAIRNPHIQAHAFEGRLFRLVLEDALQAHGIVCRIFLERSAYAQAASALARPENDVKQAVAQIGRVHRSPWRADEKLATLAAWMVLSSI